MFQARDDSTEGYLELLLASAGSKQRLRFYSPADVHLQPPFPEVGWLQIFDIRSRGLEGLNVLVSDGEMGLAIRFLARAVEKREPIDG